MTALLDAYDAQLRGAAEVRGAQRSERFGPLWLGVFAGGFGFITYEDLSHLDGAERRALIDRALARLREDPAIGLVEWKTRGHDDLPGLHEALTDAGFVPGEPESIMLGEAALLAQDLPLPEGVTLRPVTDPADVRAASAMADGVFGDPVSPERADDLLRRIAAGGEVWVAEEGGRVVSSGRLEPVPGSSRSPAPRSPGCGEAPPWRRTAIAASTARSPRPAPPARWTAASGTCTATRRSTRGRSSSAPAS